MSGPNPSCPECGGVGVIIDIMGTAAIEVERTCFACQPELLRQALSGMDLRKPLTPEQRAD